jgi:hypothetical protein
MVLSLAQADDHRGNIVRRILFCPSEERTKRELQQLDKVQREQVWADMTGHQESVDYRINAENPEFVTERVQAMNEELEAHHHKHTTSPTGTTSSSRDAYDLAVAQDVSYVERQKLKFLRADDFDASAAAARMMAHFTVKQDFFGTEALGRDVSLADDFSDDDLESLRAGGVQLLQQQDHATRGVIFSRTMNYVYKERKNLVSYIQYIYVYRGG